MDERILQLKQLKKEYKKLRARTGRGWKALAWVLLGIFVILAAATVFVMLNHLPLIQTVDRNLWEPLKAACMPQVNFSPVWDIVRQYGVAASLCSGALCLLFAIFSSCAEAKVKKSEAYLNYRTLKLTLKTEKEEK